METTKQEVVAIETANAKRVEECHRELVEIELAMIGGGQGDIGLA